MIKVKSEKQSCKSIFVLVFLLFTIYYSLFTVLCGAELIDRVVAFVDDQAITLSDFEKQLKATRAISPDVSEEDVLKTMVNRKLLLREAKKYRIEGASEEEVMKEYIDLKVRAFIRVNETDIQKFYRKNSTQFLDKSYEEVREEIEIYLIEKTVNVRLKENLEELKQKSFIKMQLRTD
jgi:hypothetical protein